MRMRKKKHLEEKLSQCTNLIDMPPVTEDYRQAILVKEYIDFEKLFGNNNPVHMEIGCGKGQFIVELASRTPEINYIAVEVNRNVICDACKKALDGKITNIIFLHCGAEVLPKYIKESSIEKLYLNFSYDEALIKGYDFAFEKYEELIKSYDEGKLDETFIDIFGNLYTADYIKFAKVNEDGRFDTVFETDYDVVPLEKNVREWVYLTDDEELLAKGKSTVTINDNDEWTIYYKTCDETGSLNYNDRNRNYHNERTRSWC